MSETKTTDTPNIAGCVIKELKKSECESYLHWLLGEENAKAPNGSAGFKWALAHSDDGVTWGHYDNTDNTDKTWQLGNSAVPEGANSAGSTEKKELDVSPPIDSETLLELRIFGKLGEVLIWRTDDVLHGRVLRETNPSTDRNNEKDPVRPSDECRILRGDQIVTGRENGFTHIADETGAQQVVPMKIDEDVLKDRRLQLSLSHYYEKDAETGVVRIAATRLVGLYPDAGK